MQRGGAPPAAEAPSARRTKLAPVCAARDETIADRFATREPWQWPSPKEIADALDGHLDGAIWRCRCPAHDDRGHDLSLAQRDGRPMVYCEAGCGPREVAAALYARGLWAEDGPRRPWRLRRRPAPIRPCESRTYARKLWRVCQPAIGTLGEAYLRERGIGGPVPVTFRFASRLEHWPSGASYPALICVMQDARGRFSGVQQIFLDGPTLAPVRPVKMTLGDPGVIRLAAPKDGTLTVASDVETALLLLGAEPGRPVWAAVGGSGLRRLSLPPRIRRVELGMRRDQVDRRAAGSLTQRLLKEGRDVRWFEPPVLLPVPEAGIEAAAG